MPGFVKDLRSFFAALDLYVMPSRAEGLGSSALLAMAHGLAVVASRVGGLPEVVEEGTTGWLTEPGSPSALAEAIAAVVSDPERRRQAGLKGRERTERFTSDIMVHRTETFYQQLLARVPD
jgi:glycosyltransferase involved in cell wall biosynthesis